MFLMIILGAMALLTVTFVTVGMKTAGTSYSNGVYNLAGRSVLAEFDRELKDRFGIFAFYGKKTTIEQKLQNYSYASFREKGHMKTDSIDVDLKEYSLLNTDAFEKEITTCAKSETLEKFIPVQQDGEQPVVTVGHRTLRNEKIINALPSEEADIGGFNVGGVINRLKSRGLDELWEKGSKGYLTDCYIFSHFKNGQYHDDECDTFFQNECEYIIAGKKSDFMNQSIIDNKLTLLRTGLNSLYIYSNPKKMEEALAMAELITPGPEAALTQIIVIEAWSVAEASNDLLLLNAGRNVTLWKTEKSWATDLDGAINGTAGGCILPAEEGGLCYEDYLKIFMSFTSQETKLMRSMDLIQINMQGTYWEGFYIKDYYLGFEFDARMNGRKLHFVEQY